MNTGLISSTYQLHPNQKISNLENPFFLSLGLDSKCRVRCHVGNTLTIEMLCLAGRQRFVVVSDCCCYCYDDELAKEPLQCFSLAGYNRYFRKSRGLYLVCIFQYLKISLSACEIKTVTFVFNYLRVYRTTSERNPFCFMVEPINRWQEKLHIFSCSSEDDRKVGDVISGVILCCWDLFSTDLYFLR